MNHLAEGRSPYSLYAILLPIRGTLLRKLLQVMIYLPLLTNINVGVMDSFELVLTKIDGIRSRTLRRIGARGLSRCKHIADLLSILIKFSITVSLDTALAKGFLPT